MPCSQACQGLFRELVIYYSDQCYPEYLVLYQRVHEKDTRCTLPCKCICYLNGRSCQHPCSQDIAEEIDKVLKRKFFMQVPLHWRTEHGTGTIDSLRSAKHIWLGFLHAGGWEWTCAAAAWPPLSLLHLSYWTTAGCHLWLLWRNVATDLTKEHFRDHHEMSGYISKGWQGSQLTDGPCKWGMVVKANGNAVSNLIPHVSCHHSGTWDIRTAWSRKHIA